jgi:hypothetical protein
VNQPKAVVLIGGHGEDLERQDVESGVAVFTMKSVPDEVSVRVIEADGAEHTHEWQSR